MTLHALDLAPDEQVPVSTSREAAPSSATSARLEIATLQWAVGGYCAGLGALMLIVPHQFDLPVYAPLRPVLPFSGGVMVSAGAALVAVATLAPGRTLTVLAHGAAAGGFFILALCFALNGSWSGFANQGLLGLVTFAAPMLGRMRTRGATPVPLLALMVGASLVTNGAALLFLGGPAFFPRPEWLLWYSSAFVVAGLVLLVAWMSPAPPAVRHAACVVAGGVLLAWLFAGTWQARFWTGVLYFGGFGLTLALLPWCGPRLARVGQRQLGSYLVLAFALLMSAPLIGVTAWVTSQAERSTREELLLSKQALAVAVARAVEEYVTLQRNALVAVSQTPGLLALPTSEQAALLQTFDRNYSEAIAWTLYNEAGDPLAKADDLPRRNVAALPTFQAVQQTGAAAFNLQIGAITGRPVVVFGAPLTDADGRFAGIAATTLETSALSELLERIAGGRARSIYLIDDQARLIAQVGGSDAPPLASLTSRPSIRAYLAAPEISALSVEERPGAETLVAYAPIRAMGWGVVVERPAASALGAVREGRERALLALLIFLLIAVVGALVFAHQLAAPVRRLTSAARQLAGGHRSVALPRAGVYEIDALADDFASMQASVLAREAALRESEARLRALFDSTTVGCALLTPQARFLQVNDAFARIVGYAADRLPELSCDDLTHPEDRAHMHQQLDRLVAGDSASFVLEKRYVRPDDSVIWVQNSVSAIRDPQGRLLQLVVISQDVSERKALEQLQQDFIANVSHELRNPLSAIRGYAQLMRRRARYEERAVDAVISQTDQLGRLIQDLLEVSRLEAGRLELHRSPVDLVARVLASAELAQAMTANHRVRVEAADTPIIGDWDADRLGQVFLNLLSNAIKYSPAGGDIVVKVSATDTAAMVAIRDQGMGLEPASLDRLFTRFYRAGIASGTVQGLGLGLFICKDLVEAHGGQVWAESAGLGCGSTFFVRLPLQGAVGKGASVA